MKKQIKKTAQLLIAFCFSLVSLTACGDEDQEIFDKADVQIEQETDEEKEKKSKPTS